MNKIKLILTVEEALEDINQVKRAIHFARFNKNGMQFSREEVRGAELALDILAKEFTSDKYFQNED